MTTIDGLTPGTWTIDPAHTEVGFTVRHLMVSKVKGRFADVSGSITVADDVLQSAVEATVQIASIDTRDENRDNHLRSADFFEADKHPTMTFRSTELRAKGSDYEMVGDLTIKDVTKSVVFALEFNGADANPMKGGAPVAGFTAETEIDRKAFGLTWNVALESGGVLVGDKIKITLEVEAGKDA